VTRGENDRGVPDVTRYIFLSAAMLALCASNALAQSDPTEMAHVSASNELGVLEYCQGKGWTDQAAVDAQKKVISALPAATDTTSVAAAEATGKQGIFDLNGNQTSLTQMASTKNTSEHTLCSQLGASVKNATANMSSMPSGMPSMPQGMPSMPNMPSSSGTTP
jgi:hypothetical protein